MLESIAILILAISLIVNSISRFLDSRNLHKRINILSDAFVGNLNKILELQTKIDKLERKNK